MVTGWGAVDHGCALSPRDKTLVAGVKPRFSYARGKRQMLTEKRIAATFCWVKPRLFFRPRRSSGGGLFGAVAAA
jgi:hypothetical protein